MSNAISKYELPKTKAPFARWLAAQSANAKYGPGRIFSCPMCQFMQERSEQFTCWQFWLESYSFRDVTKPLPHWAHQFTIKAINAATKAMQQGRKRQELSRMECAIILAECENTDPDAP